MRTIFLILLITVFTGCTSSNVNKTLKDVESYISERPDSALAVIESIDRSNLKSNRSKAHHALLHAMALDKNYIDVDDDSLSNIAVKYYHKHGPKKYLAQALYYKGLSFYYDNQHDKAIVELSKAEPIAAMYNSLYLGFIKVLEANIYNVNHNQIKATELLEQALAIYTDLDAEYYINVAKRELAASYINIERYDDAERLLTELILSDNTPSRILTKSMGDYAFLIGTCPDADYKTSIEYYEKTAEVEYGRYMSKQDYWVWAHALAKTGDYDRSRQIVELLSPIDSSGTAYYWKYAIAKSQGKTSEALDFFEKFSDKNNEEVVQILRQPPC